MLHGLMSMLYLDVLDLDYIIVVIGLNYELNSKKQKVLRTVPTIVIAHTFCASPDTRISYW